MTARITPSNFGRFGAQGVTVGGTPILNQHSGNVYWVDSNADLISSRGSFSHPAGTIARALALCKPGDTIIVKANHAESLAAAGDITISLAGISIIGMGVGTSRPTITFGTATSASVLVTGAGVSIENIIGVAGINALTNPFNIQAAGCYLDIEWQDPTTILEAVRAILTNASADKLVARLRYMGQTGGSSCVNAVRLVGCDEALVDVDFYGKASTAVVEFVTTACTGIRVTGKMYNSGTLDGSKNVIDTVTGSKWMADFTDFASGQKVFGGSALAISGGNASPGALQRYLAAKVIANANVLTTGASPVNMFIVTGQVLARVYGTVQTLLTSTLNNGTLAIGVSGNTGVFLAATTVDGTQFPAGSVWVDTAPTVKAKALAGVALNWAPVNNTNIIGTVATNSLLAGALTLYCEWMPLSPGATVVAA